MVGLLGACSGVPARCRDLGAPTQATPGNSLGTAMGQGQGQSVDPWLAGQVYGEVEPGAAGMMLWKDLATPGG